MPLDFLRLDGAEITSSVSGANFNMNFFARYNTSDFLKNFDIVVNELSFSIFIRGALGIISWNCMLVFTSFKSIFFQSKR